MNFDSNRATKTFSHGVERNSLSLKNEPPFKFSDPKNPYFDLKS